MNIIKKIGAKACLDLVVDCHRCDACRKLLNLKPLYTYEEEKKWYGYAVNLMREPKLYSTKEATKHIAMFVFFKPILYAARLYYFRRLSKLSS